MMTSGPGDEEREAEAPPNRPNHRSTCFSSPKATA